MNLIYTGDIFIAHCCETEGWAMFSESDKTNGVLQNNDAYIPVVETPVDPSDPADPGVDE